MKASAQGSLTSCGRHNHDWLKCGVRTPTSIAAPSHGRVIHDALHDFELLDEKRNNKTLQFRSSHSAVMKKPRLKARNALPKCQNPDCKKKAKTLRSKFCFKCFVQQAGLSGAGSSGNVKKGISKKRAGAKSSGNIKKGISKKRAGAKSSGNKKKGTIKKDAGERSALKRSSKVAFVVKKHWLDKILGGEKDMEIRGCATRRRGWVHLAESKATGVLVGRARLVDCIKIARAEFMSHLHRHCVNSLEEVPYDSIFAWILEDAVRFVKPFAYKHKPGAVIWVKV